MINRDIILPAILFATCISSTLMSAYDADTKANTQPSWGEQVSQLERGAGGREERESQRNPNGQKNTTPAQKVGESGINQNDRQGDAYRRNNWNGNGNGNNGSGSTIEVDPYYGTPNGAPPPSAGPNSYYGN